MNCPARIVPPVPAPKPAPTHVQKPEQKFITTGGEHASGYTQGGQVVVEEVDEIALPLPMNVTKKSIEEREKRAVMLAEESFKHINQQVSRSSNCWSP